MLSIGDAVTWWCIGGSAERFAGSSRASLTMQSSVLQPSVPWKDRSMTASSERLTVQSPVNVETAVSDSFSLIPEAKIMREQLLTVQPSVPWKERSMTVSPAAISALERAVGDSQFWMAYGAVTSECEKSSQ